MAQHRLGAGIDGDTAETRLILAQLGLALLSPMKGHDDDIRLQPRRLHIGAYVGFMPEGGARLARAGIKRVRQGDGITEERDPLTL